MDLNEPSTQNKGYIMTALYLPITDRTYWHELDHPVLAGEARSYWLPLSEMPSDWAFARRAGSAEDLIRSHELVGEIANQSHPGVYVIRVTERQRVWLDLQGLLIDPAKLAETADRD
jgi:hypothetical protein